MRRHSRRSCAITLSGLARGPQPASAVRGFRAWCASRLVSPNIIANNNVEERPLRSCLLAFLVCAVAVVAGLPVAKITRAGVQDHDRHRPSPIAILECPKRTGRMEILPVVTAPTSVRRSALSVFQKGVAMIAKAPSNFQGLEMRSLRGCVRACE